MYENIVQKDMNKFLIFLFFQNDREHRPVQPWALICDILLSRNLKAGTVFQLRQGTDISLLCEVHPLPHFSISEEVIDHNTNRFLLRHNSETPVWNFGLKFFKAEHSAEAECEKWNFGRSLQIHCLISASWKKSLITILNRLLLRHK